jgi:hypothetical protein
VTISRTDQEMKYDELMEDYFKSGAGSFNQKLQAWPKYVSRQSMAIFLYKVELFQRILRVQGSIIEFGVFLGTGLFTWAKLSSIFEPVNYQRKVIGFDTFEGFPSIDKRDLTSETGSRDLRVGGFGVDGAYEDLLQGIELFDRNRSIGHIPKMSLVRGDVQESLPRFLHEHPHTLVSLLYLDLDLYEPTKLVLEQLFDRVPRGGVIAFDEVNSEEWPGETCALLGALGASQLRLERVPYEPLRCFAVKE